MQIWTSKKRIRFHGICLVYWMTPARMHPLQMIYSIKCTALERNGATVQHPIFI